MKRSPLWIESDNDVTDVQSQIAEHLSKKTNCRSAVGESGKVRTNNPHAEQQFSRCAAETSDEKDFIRESQNETGQKKCRLDRQKGAQIGDVFQSAYSGLRARQRNVPEDDHLIDQR